MRYSRVVSIRERPFARDEKRRKSGGAAEETAGEGRAASEGKHFSTRAI